MANHQTNAVRATNIQNQEVSYYIGNIPANRNAANYNYAIGDTALDALTTGDQNLAIGFQALNDNTVGSHNIALGYDALAENIQGTRNIAIGNSSLKISSTGQYNVAVGHSSLFSNTSGSYNTAIGEDALRKVTQGDFNTALGFGAGDNITTGDNNIMIGYDTNPHVANGDNQIVIGHDADGLGNNYAVIGDSNIERLYAAEDAGAVVYAGGINLSGGTTVSAVKFGTVTMSTNASQAFTVSGVTSSSIVTASFKSGDNGRYIKTVVPSTDTITITLDNPADGGVIMYIVIN